LSQYNQYNSSAENSGTNKPIGMQPMDSNARTGSQCNSNAVETLTHQDTGFFFPEAKARLFLN